MAKGRVAGRSFSIFHEGRNHSFLPGERVPADIVERVKNPKIWQPREDVLEVTGSVSDEAPSEGGEDEEFEEVGGDAEGSEGGDAENELDATLDSLTVKQLIELADETGVDRTGLTKKADLIGAIKAHGSL